MPASWTTDGQCPVLLYLDPNGQRRSVPLGGRPEADVCLPWDPEISRLHAEMLQRAGEWVIADDGLSQNGTFVNGMRVEGRRRLHDGDLITLGSTSLTFCDPRGSSADITLALPDMQPVRTYSQQQQRIICCLCSPLLGDGEGVAPATDAEIAEE